MNDWIDPFDHPEDPSVIPAVTTMVHVEETPTEGAEANSVRHWRLTLIDAYGAQVAHQVAIRPADAITYQMADVGWDMWHDEQRVQSALDQMSLVWLDEHGTLGLDYRTTWGVLIDFPMGKPQ